MKFEIAVRVCFAYTTHRHLIGEIELVGWEF